MPDPDEDLDYWLATQTLPKEEPAQAGAWERAAQLLSRQQRPADPMPTRQNGMSWAAALAAIAGRDPGGVLTADANSRRADMEAWQKRNGPDAQFDRQRMLAGTLMHEDSARRAAEGADWQRQHTEGRDAASDQHWNAEQQRAQTGQDATIENMRASRALQERGLTQADAHFGVTQAGLDRRNTEDNAAALARAQAIAAAKAQGAAVAPIPGTHVTDPVAYQQYMGSPANIKDATEHVGRANQVQGYVKQLRDLLTADRSAANEASYNSIIKQLIGDRSQEGSTGVLSNTEFARYIEDLPEYGVTGGMKNWRSALETVQGKNPRLSTLDALDAALQKGQGAKFGAYGFQMGAGPAAPPPAAAGAQQTPPPFKFEEDDDLGVTYGR